MEITGGAIAGYAYGLISLLVGLVSALFGVLFILAGTSGGGWVFLFGAVLLIGAIVAMPATRRLLARFADINFSRGAVVGVCGCASVIATILFVFAIIGLLGNVSSAAPGADVSNVSVDAADVSGADKSSLAVTWNTRAQSAVDPDTSDMSSYQAEDGQKFVVLRVKIKNKGSGDADLTPRFFKLESSGVVYDYQGLFGSANGISGVTLRPGATHSGWIVFSVPEDMTQATLTVDGSVYYETDVAVEFTHDEAMPINVSD